MSGEDERLVRHRTVSAVLASWSDETMVAALAGGDHIGVGIGGSTACIDVGGTPVFVKLVALTRLEGEPEHVRCTANLFDLPSWYQYGVGSAGFGAWRELSAHELATGWVLDGICSSFPLLHHSRVLLHRLAVAAPDEDAEGIERAVRFWDGSPAVRHRLNALAEAPATLVLALEYVPDTLHAWLARQLTAGDGSAAVACHYAEGQLLEAVRCMGVHGLSHFDAHFRNVLADGQRIYVSDFGLAASRRFEITAAERHFLDHTARHDLAYVVTELANAVVTSLAVSGGPAARNAYLRRCAQNGAAPGLSAGVAEVVRRYAPVAAVMNDFYWSLHEGKPTTPYPAEQVEKRLIASGLRPLSLNPWINSIADLRMIR